jgi:hypothetical protein
MNEVLPRTGAVISSFLPRFRLYRDGTGKYVPAQTQPSVVLCVFAEALLFIDQTGSLRLAAGSATNQKARGWWRD